MLFSEATAVVADGGVYRARIHEGWDINGNANGGYLMAIATRALSAATGRPDPIATSAFFLAPGRVGDVTITVVPIKTGKRFATASATLADATGKPILQVMSSLGEAHDDATSLTIVEPPTFELPSPEHCVPRSDSSINFHHRLEMLIHPDDDLAGEPSGRCEMRGWFRLPNDEPMDAHALVQAFDAFPPAIFNSGHEHGWVPTVELTAHIRAVPVGPWLKCRFTSRFVSNGYLEEDGEIWDTDGRFLGQSRQLGLTSRP